MCGNFAMKTCTSKAWWAALGLQEDAFSCAAADTGNGSCNREAVVSKVAFKGYAGIVVYPNLIDRPWQM
jgi:hypothetical protein